MKNFEFMSVTFIHPSSPFIYINYFLHAVLCDVHADTR